MKNNSGIYFDIPKVMGKKFKVKCAQKGETQKEVLTNLIKKWLDKK